MPFRNKIHYQLTGEGPPLVFVHGFLGFWRNFYSISQAFKGEYSSLLYDQRGHGLSLHKAPYTVEQFTQDLKDLLDHLNWRSVVLVGHSFGGYVSCLLAHRHAGYVQKMVIVDSSPWPRMQTGQKVIELLSSLPFSFKNRTQAKEFFQQSVEDKKLSKVMADFLMANLEKNREGPVKFVFDAPGLLKYLKSKDWQAPDYPSIIKSLKIPTLLLRGEKSGYFLKPDFEKALKLNPLVKGREIKNSRHWLHSDQPQAFIQALKEFLNHNSY